MSFSPRPIFAVDKGELITYVYVSASAGQIWSWGQGGEGDLKKCAYLWKNPAYAPDFPQCFCHCVSAVNMILYLIISCLIFNDVNHL